MKLAVCGCSWSATSVLEEFKGTHFSEIVADAMGAELYNFAVGGASNFVIRLQIDEAIKIKPDLVIVTPTYPDRIEIPTNSKIIKTEISLADIYNSHIHNNDLNTPIRTYTLPNLAEKNYHSIKEYMVYYYQPLAKLATDRWIIRDGLTQLKNSGIKFLVQPQLLWDDQYVAYPFLSSVALQKNIITNDKCVFYNRVHSESSFDPGFHTTLETQQLFAKNLQILIKEIII